ncbi:MAG TPA: FkbM family methyltransferase [Solirubrobacteraceae bacterium]|jgi:FkbM family methyltransferase
MYCGRVWRIVRWRGQHLWQTLRIVRPRLAFLLGEARGGTRRYRVGAMSVVVRHRSRDVDIVNEIWGARPSYEPPTSLVARLRDRSLCIVDLGGNIGLFGVFALARWRVSHLISFEPDPANAVILRRVREINDVAGQWTVRECAVANFSGEMGFVSLGSPESHRPEPGRSGMRVSVTDLFAIQDSIDLLKIDIEGGEWALLSDERLRLLRAEIIVMEWHWRDAPSGDAHGAALDALVKAGYQIHSDVVSDVAGVGMIWAARPLSSG